MRAYTDSIAQALCDAEKVPIVRVQTLRCRVPYALEGLLRREIELAGAALGKVTHGAFVELAFALPEEAAQAFVSRVGESGQGKVEWLGEDEA